MHLRDVVPVHAADGFRRNGGKGTVACRCRGIWLEGAGAPKDNPPPPPL